MMDFLILVSVSISLNIYLSQESGFLLSSMSERTRKDEPRIELIADGMLFTEGPAIDLKGNLFFTDVRDRKIYRYDQKGELTVFLDNTGGANGLFFADNGDLIACAGKARKVIRITPEGSVSTVASQYQGKKLNSPNDVWIHDNGHIYFTDPRYGDTGDLEQDGMHVYRINPGNNSIQRLTDDLVRPNGIVGDSNAGLLYVVDQGIENTYRYRILPDGNLSDKELFVSFGTDGMSIDTGGNVYITHQRSVKCFSEDGKLWQEINFDHMTTNVVYYESRLYVTTQGGEVFLVTDLN